MLKKAIAWLLDDAKIGPHTAERLRQHCLPAETDKQRALRLLQMYGCADILRLSADQVELIRSVVERCPDDSVNLEYMVKVDGIMQGPAPAPSKPKLAIGQIWRRRDGETATVDSFVKLCDDDPYPFGAGGNWYTDEGGLYIHGEDHLDLVEYLGQDNPPCEH